LTDQQRLTVQFAAALAPDTDAPREFEESFRAWFQKVAREVMRAGAKTREEAEDATMEAFREIINAGKPVRYTFAYVRTAAINNFRNEKKRYRARVVLGIDEPDDDHRLKAEDRQLRECEGQLWLEDLFSELPPRQREVMECVAAGLSNEEIARKLGKSADAVRRSKSDACSALRKRIRSDGEYRRLAAPDMVPGRNASRAVDKAVAAAESLAASHRDLRAMNPSEREDTAAKLNELQELLRGCPAWAFGPQGSVQFLTDIAALSTVLIADRDELAALRLIRSARPHLGFVGRHQAARDLECARAEALCELGFPRCAQSLLRGLNEMERQVFGTVNPRTAMLLHWAQAMSGQLLEAEAGFSDLEARLAQSQGSGTSMLLHVQCRHAWLWGALGRVSKSACGYDSVILSRTRKLGSSDSDALDGRHSKGKMLVFNGAGSQAITILQSVADDRTRVQGDRHPDTLETLKYLHLARVRAEPRDDRVLDAAIESLEQILRTQASRQRPGYPMSRDTATWLAWLRQGRAAIRFGESTLTTVPSALIRLNER
jgi:RNA polymerase sigma factor (sigma-70 family)